MANVTRRVDDWLSTRYLTDQQLEFGLTFHELCIFLFTCKLSRGYDDERVILQVFLMFQNRANAEGKYGSLSYDHVEMDAARMTVNDLRVFLFCIFFLHQK